MLTRLISALILGVIALGATLYSAVTFTIFIVAMMSVGVYELFNMCKGSKFYTFMGLGYLFLGCMSMIFMRMEGLVYILFLFAVVWSCDSFAYIFGIRFGKHKLAPKVSPKKSWEGAIYGSLSATVVGTLMLTLTGVSSVAGAIFISLVCAIVTVLGDLLESKIKRDKGIKDSGNLIPGHGGVLDRIDGLIPVAITAFLWFLG